MSAPSPTLVPPHAPIDVVLDTNVWLDLLVFGDAGVTAIARALADGRLRAHTNALAAAEFARVLPRPRGRFSLDDAGCSRARSAFAAQSHRFHGPDRLPPRAMALPPLPLCRDPDDQPFLLLARACGARWLITKDRDLLLLARRLATEFAILTPPAASDLLARA